jgi:hypothetical protein
MKNNKTEYFPISTLREELRLRASEYAGRLSRSVGRLTSCDHLPCMEYGEEVQAEQSLAKELFYLQHCRNALEHCIGSGGATLRYRWGDGRVTHTRFRKIGPGRVKVTGLQP